MTTEILPFAGAPDADVIDQAVYAALPARTDGFSTGTAESGQVNKVLRQSSFIAAGIASWLDGLGISVLDDGDLTTLVAQITQGLEDSMPAVMTGATSSTPGAMGQVTAPVAGDQDKVLSGAGTWVAGQFTTGDVKLTLKSVADTGWVLMNDLSIGSVASNATGRANADTATLFALLWNNVSNAFCPTQDSTGVSVARGVSAAADFAANRRIVLPRAVGRALAGYGSGSGLTARGLGEYLGEESTILTEAQIPAHVHTQDPLTIRGGGSTNGLATGNNAKTVGGGTTASTGGGDAHNTMQPTLFLNVMIKL